MTRDRILVIVLALWGLAMIVPDLVRVVHPLGSFGLYADNDGLIYSVSGPFEDRASSPAWQAGIRVGDRLDLERLKCRPSDISSCGPAFAVLGGMDFVMPGQEIALPLAATEQAPAREVILVATGRPANFLVRTVNLLCQIAGIAVVIAAAAWLVWTRPSAMSWGFFLYVNWFNPGQEYAFYAILQQWPASSARARHRLDASPRPPAMPGFLLFVLRVPNNTTEPRWRPVERALPLVGSYSSRSCCSRPMAALFGYPRRDGHARDDPRSASPSTLLRARHSARSARRRKTPEDYQRVRWVIWGCLIGLPTFLHRRARLRRRRSSTRAGATSRRPRT